MPKPLPIALFSKGEQIIITTSRICFVYLFVYLQTALVIHVIGRFYVLVLLGVPQEPKELKMPMKLLFCFKA